jgi:hypothetical protein
MLGFVRYIAYNFSALDDLAVAYYTLIRSKLKFD